MKTEIIEYKKKILLYFILCVQINYLPICNLHRISEFNPL